MGQQVVYIQNNLDGLRLKNIGCFAQGAKWPIDAVPELLIEKMKSGDSFTNSKGNKVPIASCFAADGSEIEFKNAYIPRFNIGSPPIPAVIHESSSKPRKTSAGSEDTDTGDEGNANEDSDVTDGDEDSSGSDSSDSETPEDTDGSENSSNKKKKKKKKSP